MSIKNVKIKNFTVFNDISVDFSNGVNVIIGENGTGKTHLMKAMYSMINVEDDNLVATLGKYFQSDNYLESLTQRGKDIVLALSSDVYKLTNESDYLYTKNTIVHNPRPDQDVFTISHGNDAKYTFGYTSEKEKSLFLLAKDMLTHSKGFVSLYDELKIPFDKSYRDLLSKSLLPESKKISLLAEKVLAKIEHLIDGKVIVENDTFYTFKSNGTKIKFSLEAEGIKKIATLWQFIMNGSITKGSVLFWDEPEANINPSLYKDVAEILLELSRNGVQIFIATHNYNFAKYIEVLSKDSDNVRYHSLYKTDDGVKCETEEKFTLLSNNALREDNINLYDAEMKKEFEE
ncbi:MAG: AAA family ATPase [Eubacteriales bacterium]